jgi:hypothetical protein
MESEDYPMGPPPVISWLIGLRGDAETKRLETPGIDGIIEWNIAFFELNQTEN